MRQIYLILFAFLLPNGVADAQELTSRQQYLSSIKEIEVAVYVFEGWLETTDVDESTRLGFQEFVENLLRENGYTVVKPSDDERLKYPWIQIRLNYFPAPTGIYVATYLDFGVWIQRPNSSTPDSEFIYSTNTRSILVDEDPTVFTRSITTVINQLLKRREAG